MQGSEGKKKHTQKEKNDHKTCQMRSARIEPNRKAEQMHALFITPQTRRRKFVKMPYLTRINEKKKH